MKNKTFLAFVLSVIVTLSAAIYQRMTGPTYPKTFKIETSLGEYKIKLKRSQNLTRDFYVELPNAPANLNGVVYYRVYPGNFKWDSVKMQKENDVLKALLPSQPAAGKLEYFIVLNENGKEIKVAEDEPVIIRFKGDVPASIMIPHVLFMFFAMFFSNLTGILILLKKDNYRKYLKIAFVLLVLGGAVLGPIVQKYAFGHYWTGWPMGEDLTDNKTLIALIAFLIAFIANLKKQRPKIAFAAVLILFLVYMIPHSLRGSERNPETGQVVTGN